MHVQFLIILIHHSTRGNASSNTQLNHNTSVLMTTQFLHFHLGLFLHFRIGFRKKHSFTLQKDNLSCTHTLILQTREKIIVVSLIYLKWYFLCMYRTINHSWSSMKHRQVLTWYMDMIWKHCFIDQWNDHDVNVLAHYNFQHTPESFSTPHNVLLILECCFHNGSFKRVTQ